MIEFFNALIGLTLFGSVLWAMIALIIFIIICFISDVKENGFISFIFLILLFIGFHFWGDGTYNFLASIISWEFISIYLAIGLGYAFIRVFFYGRDQGKKLLENKDKSDYLKYRVERNIKNHVFRWWTLWPISFINWVIQDFIRDIYNWAYTKLNKIFNFVLDLGVKSVPGAELDTEEKLKE